MFFPLRQYLAQLLIDFGTPLTLNPFEFWRQYQLERLERCWQIDPIQQLEQCWQRDIAFEAYFHHFFQD